MTLQPETQGKYAKEIAGYEALLHKELQNRLVKENTTSLSFILLCVVNTDLGVSLGPHMIVI